MTAQDLRQGQTAANEPGGAPAPQEAAGQNVQQQPAAPPNVDMNVEMPEPYPADVEAGGASPQEAVSSSASTPVDVVSDADSNAAEEAKPVEFEALDTTNAPQAGENLDLLLDVTVALSVELGTAEIPLSEILGLGPDSVVKLDRAVGEPVDILINRELVGRGEVVVVEDHLGVRVTELLRSPANSKPGSER